MLFLHTNNYKSKTVVHWAVIGVRCMVNGVVVNAMSDMTRFSHEMVVTNKVLTYRRIS